MCTWRQYDANSASIAISSRHSAGLAIALKTPDSLRIEISDISMKYGLVTRLCITRYNFNVRLKLSSLYNDILNRASVVYLLKSVSSLLHVWLLSSTSQ